MSQARALLAALLLAVVTCNAHADAKHVAIVQIVEHPSLDAVHQGIVDELADAGFVANQNFKLDYQNAQGNPATAAQIARKFIGDTPDVIIAISTPAAQAVAAATRDIPIVFSAVSDPVGAKLVRDMAHPEGNITGTSDVAPLAEQLGLIKEITPNAKTLGVIYNSGEANSVSLVGLLKELAASRGFTIIEAVASKSSEVLNAARKLAGNVDAIYIPLDNTVISALEAVIKVGREAKIPIYSADTDSVDRGTLAALGFDYYDVGRQTGQQVVRILKGEKPSAIPVERVNRLNLFANPEAAEAIGLTLPEAVLERALNLVAE